TDKNILHGLQNTAWSARFEVVNDAKERFNISVPHDKTLVLDGGHNPQGALILSDSIKKYFAKKKVALVLGILADKDFEGMVKVLAPNANSVTVVTPPSPRALDANKLKECVDKYCGKVSVCGDIKVAVQNALQGEDDVTVLCGSLTLFSALLEDK
ncbi:MAG: cyanophycin synthetase, partial [Clostridia bacterium]